MKNSVIIRCYNTLPLIKKCLDAVIKSTDQNTEIILVNNHPPYQDVMDYLYHLNHPRVKVLDPGQNLGNVRGFDYGADHSTGENLIILDDDTIVPNNNWIEVMSQSFEDFPQLAFVSLVWPAVLNRLKSTPSPPNLLFEKKEYTIRFMTNAIFIFFGCVMIKSSLWKKHFKNIKIDLPLYRIEPEYKKKAVEIGMDVGYILSHMAEHLSRTEEADPLNGAWKVFYAFGLTQKSYPDWRENKNSLSHVEEYSLNKFGYPQSQITEIKELLEGN
ncbi:glycosyltransferase family A protein [Chengkuizengella sp. SCS-71B]|uniref:glycosyltransferase family A protein n=1 Tax=Chengkuizengella sp. SCS-71B TaxID=3115290 RepID=UPI0032C22ED5